MKKLNNLKLEVQESPYKKHNTVDNCPLQTLDLVIYLMSKVPTADMLLNENSHCRGRNSLYTENKLQNYSVKNVLLYFIMDLKCKWYSYHKATVFG